MVLCVRKSWIVSRLLIQNRKLIPSSRLLITEFIKEVSPLLLHPCHFQDYGRSMLYPAQPGSEGYFPKMCADEVNEEDEGQVWGESER